MVPAAPVSHSKIPIGPFQIIVLDFKITDLDEFKIPSLWADKGDDIVKQIDNSNSYYKDQSNIDVKK